MDVAFQCPTKPVTPRNLFVNVFFHFLSSLKLETPCLLKVNKKRQAFLLRDISWIMVGFPKDRWRREWHVGGSRPQWDGSHVLQHGGEVYETFGGGWSMRLLGVVGAWNEGGACFGSLGGVMNGAKDFKCFPAYVEECFFRTPESCKSPG